MEGYIDSIAGGIVGTMELLENVGTKVKFMEYR